MKLPFCDICGVEITNNNKFPYEIEKDVLSSPHKKKINVRISLRHNIGGNNEHEDLCKYCLIDVVTNIDDRTKQRKVN